MTCARTFGVQKAAYILQKKKIFFFLFSTIEAALPCSIKLNSKVTINVIFSTPWPSEKKKPLKKQLKLPYNIYENFVWF